MIKYKIKFRAEPNLMSTVEQNPCFYYFKTKIMKKLGRYQGRDSKVKARRKKIDSGAPLGKNR